MISVLFADVKAFGAMLKDLILDIDMQYIGMCLICLAFFMRTDLFYLAQKAPAALVFKFLPEHLLCMLIGIGLERIIAAYFKAWPRKFILMLASIYFPLLYIVLRYSCLLWSKHTELTTLAFFALFVGLLRRLENSYTLEMPFCCKNRLEILLAPVFAFFIVFQLAYVPIDKVYTPDIPSQVNIPFDTAFEDNRKILEGLEQEKWEKLDLQKRLDLLQTVVNIEVSHLGLNYAIPLKAVELDQNTHGFYDEKERVIYINTKKVQYETGYSMLNSIAHECYHGYEASLVFVYDNRLQQDERNMLHFRKLEQYKKEMQNYSNGKIDYEKYYHQQIEIDARKYGNDRVVDYYVKLK